MTVALACTIGLHWSFLQSVAWTSMLLDNLSAGSFSEAVQRTFDGRHPCSLCKVIDESKKAEKKSEKLPALKKLEGTNQYCSIVILPPAAFSLIQAADTVFANLSHAPPTPPPRTA